MAKLVIKKKGQAASEVVIDDTREWIAGRKPDADIVLDPEKGISREHFKISNQNGQWKLECLSKLGNLFNGGELVTTLDLQPGTTFTLPPYDFEFSDEAKVDTVGGSQAFNVSDQTVVHRVSLAAYIKIVNQDGDLQQKIKLEGGDTWVAGRDVSAQIMISDHRVSRRQFEIRKTSIGFEIIDLGSVNGTYINEKILEGNESITLKSGDIIRVLDHTLVFEIHDPRFFEKVENLPSVAFEEPPVEEIYQQPDMYQADPNAYQQAPPPPEPMAPAVDPAAERTKKFRIGLLIIAVIVGLLFLLDLEEEQPQAPSLNASTPTSDPLAALTPQQKSEYRQSLELAKRYYMEGNYSLSLSEAEEMIKTYKVNDPDLEKLKNTALAAIETQKQLLKQEKEEKERQLMETKIAVTVSNCEKNLATYNSEEDLDNCLVEALQLNPSHNLIVALKGQLQAILVEREARKQKQSEYNKRVQQLVALYNSAKASEKDSSYLDVIASYKKVINSSLPDPNGHKQQSERRLVQLKNQMDKKIKEFEDQAEQFRQKQDYKNAVLTLRAAIKIDPTRKDLKDRAEELKNELRKLMMVHYQEGVLEESFGNVEGGDNRAGAKEKWKKIISEDLTDGEYYQKAYIKLKKYGAQ